MEVQGHDRWDDIEYMNAMIREEKIDLAENWFG